MDYSNMRKDYIWIILISTFWQTKRSVKFRHSIRKCHENWPDSGERTTHDFLCLTCFRIEPTTIAIECCWTFFLVFICIVIHALIEDNWVKATYLHSTCQFIKTPFICLRSLLRSIYFQYVSNTWVLILYLWVKILNIISFSNRGKRERRGRREEFIGEESQG